MDFSRRLLEQFVVLAEELHFSRAAERLSMSQPPLTQAIKRLEKTIGVPLLERSTRQVELTPAGKSFALDARHLLDAQSSATERARRIARGAEGTLRLGFVSGASYVSVPRLIGMVHGHLPGLRIHLYQRTSAELADMVRSRRLDLAMVRAPLADPDHLDIRLLHDEPLVCALPAEHDLASRDNIALADLRDQDFALPSSTALPGLSQLIYSGCRAEGFEPRDGGRADSLMGMLGLVAAAHCVCLVPREIRDGTVPGITYRPLVDAPRLHTLVIASAARSDPLVDRVMALVGHPA
ncbi:LysR substrate-binding domain-containing protein [Rhodococcus sp. NPDC056960]|uniref:LysR substrate-binding domain-containing protein n=1 Tax=Rhodococcus sp. NPDC056960 TaxID=3345982 RepID=UPI0036414A66